MERLDINEILAQSSGMMEVRVIKSIMKHPTADMDCFVRVNLEKTYLFPYLS